MRARISRSGPMPIPIPMALAKRIPVLESKIAPPPAWMTAPMPMPEPMAEPVLGAVLWRMFALMYWPTTGARLVRLVLAAAILGLAGPAHADDVGRWNVQIAEASARFGIPAAWIERVMRAESAGHTDLAGRPIRSAKGAMGLMQLMPGTWADMRARLSLGSDPDDPRDNILAGTYYLRLLHDQFGYPGLFAAYNAGPQRYAQYLSGRALPAETVAYLAKTTGWAIPTKFAVSNGRAAVPSLFVSGTGMRDPDMVSTGNLGPGGADAANAPSGMTTAPASDGQGTQAKSARVGAAATRSEPEGPRGSAPLARDPLFAVRKVAP